jgi:hypothetical protein
MEEALQRFRRQAKRELGDRNGAERRYSDPPESGGDARLGQPAAAPRHAAGSGTLIGSSIAAGGCRCAWRPCRRPDTTARSSRPLRRRAFRRRRRLTLVPTRRGLQRPGQPLNFAPQAITLASELRALVAQSITFLSRVLNRRAEPAPALAERRRSFPTSYRDRSRGAPGG